jgi:PH (Pleckstrin Homology) domain-containing protein
MTNQSGEDAPARSETSAGSLAFPLSALLVGLGGFALFAALLVLSNLDPGIDSSDRHLERQNPLVTVMFASLALLGVYVVLAYLIERHEFDAEELRYCTVTRRGAVKWEDITRFGYSSTARWLRLETRDGRVVRMSIMLNGLRGFARAVLARVPVDRIDPPAQTLLQSAVRGHLPSVWR